MVKPRIVRWGAKWRPLASALVEDRLWRAAYQWCRTRNEAEAMASFRRK